MKLSISDPNFPVDGEGRVYHVGVKRGEVANRIVTAGDSERIRRFSKFLDPVPIPFECLSSRGFLTITGKYKGVPISLISIGMGYPNMDFMVREARHVVDGSMAIIRFGSCGSIDPTLAVGSVGVPRECMTINTRYDYWAGEDGEKELSPFIVSKPIAANPALHEKLMGALNTSVQSSTCEVRDIKLHASADLFYSNQGRLDVNFDDNNGSLLDDLSARYPELTSLEMETAHLFHLARTCKTKGALYAAASHMVFASRTPGGEGKQTFIDPVQVALLEPLVGRACMDAVIAMDLETLHPEAEAVWRS